MNYIRYTIIETIVEGYDSMREMIVEGCVASSIISHVPPVSLFQRGIVSSRHDWTPPLHLPPQPHHYYATPLHLHHYLHYYYQYWNLFVNYVTMKRGGIVLFVWIDRGKRRYNQRTPG